MPLNNGAINQIMPFASDGREELGDLEPLSTYAIHQLRLRGHQPGLAQRAIENRALRQALHMASGVAQFIANRHVPGVNDDGDLDAVEAGLVAAVNEAIAAALPEVDEGLTKEVVAAMILAAIQKIDLSPYATNAALANGLATTMKQGPHIIGIPAMSFYPPVLATQPSIHTGLGNRRSWAFSPTGSDYYLYEIPLPPSWNGKTLKPQLCWILGSNTASGANIALRTGLLIQPPGALIVPGWTHTVTSTVPCPVGTNQIFTTDLPDLTVDVVQARDWRVFGFAQRLGATDTANGYAYLAGLNLFYQMNKGDDS